MKKIIFTLITIFTMSTAHAQSAIEQRLAEVRAERMDLRDQYKACLDEGGEKEACKTQVAGVTSPIEEKRTSFTWHPTAVAIGAIAGGAVGGIGAIIVGGLVGEFTARVVKDEEKDVEQKTE